MLGRVPVLAAVPNDQSLVLQDVSLLLKVAVRAGLATHEMKVEVRSEAIAPIVTTVAIAMTEAIVALNLHQRRVNPT